MAEERKKIDWEKIDAEYRAGVLSVREIASRYGCSEGAIRKRAKKEGWSRDLSAKIENEVRARLVRSEVRTESKISEREIVEANAQAILNIRLEHRSDIRRAKDIVSRLFDEVDGAVVGKDSDHQSEVLSLPQRVDCVRKLTDSAKTLIGLEREAWGIKTDDHGDKAPTIGELLLPDHVLELIGK